MIFFLHVRQRKQCPARANATGDSQCRFPTAEVNNVCPFYWLDKMSGTVVPFHYMQGVKLSLFSPEEIKKLSVKKLTNPETFDALLHPNFGGLYDPTLGPTDKDDLCGTCAQNYIFCPGHFGHMELPLPVYHPLFFKVLLQILRSSCFKCGQLLFSRTVRHIFLR